MKEEEENKNIFDTSWIWRRCIFVMTDGYVMQLVFASANVFEQVHICLNTYVFTRIKTGQEKKSGMAK